MEARAEITAANLGTLVGAFLSIGRADLISEPFQCFGPEVPIDMWPLDPEFSPDPDNPFKQYDQDAVRARIWKQSIEFDRGRRPRGVV